MDNNLNQEIFPIEILLKIMKIGKVYKMALLSHTFYQEAIKYFKQCKRCKSIILPIIGYTNCQCSWYCNKCIANDYKKIQSADDFYEFLFEPTKCSICNKNMCSSCGNKESLYDSNTIICNNCFENESYQLNCSYNESENCLSNVTSRCKICQSFVCKNHIIQYGDGCYNCQRCNVIGCTNMDLYGRCRECTRQYCINHAIDKNDNGCLCNCKLHCNKCGILSLKFKIITGRYKPVIYCNNCIDLLEQVDLTDLSFHIDPGYGQQN